MIFEMVWSNEIKVRMEKFCNLNFRLYYIYSFSECGNGWERQILEFIRNGYFQVTLNY